MDAIIAAARERGVPKGELYRMLLDENSEKENG